MTDLTPFADKRDALRARIDAAERRNADRTLADQAREAADAAMDYTRANPAKVIGGAVLVGLVIGLLTRPGRQVASNAARSTAGAISGAAASTSRTAKRLTSGRRPSLVGRTLGDAIAGYAATFIAEMRHAAHEGKERADELGEVASKRSKRLASDTADAASSAADSTRALARKTADAASDLVRDLARKTRG